MYIYYALIQQIYKSTKSLNILRNTLFQLRYNTIQSISEKLEEFSVIRKESYNISKDKISSNQLTEICKNNQKRKEAAIFRNLQKTTVKIQKRQCYYIFLTIQEKIKSLKS